METPPTLSPTRIAAIVEAIVFDKQLRVDIDALTQRLKAAPGSAERTLSLRALQTAKHWLGEDLNSLGAANPYPNSKDVTNCIVDPPADTYHSCEVKGCGTRLSSGSPKACPSHQI